MAPPAEPHQDRVAPDLDRMFAAAPFGVVLVDRQGRCAQVNATVGPLLGLQVGDHLIDAVPGCAELTRSIEATFGSGVAQPELEVVTRVDGAPRWLAFECFPVRAEDPAGPIVAGVLVREVTDRRAREERLVDRVGVAAAAQEVAESTARREQVLRGVTAAFAAAVTPEEVADIVIRAVLECVDADGGALYLVDDSGTRLHTIASNYPMPWGAPQLDVAVDAGYPVCAAVREAEPQFISDADDLYRRFPALADLDGNGHDWGRHAALPLGLTGSLGAMAFSWTVPGEFAERDREFLAMIAAQCSLALKPRSCSASNVRRASTRNVLRRTSCGSSASPARSPRPWRPARSSNGSSPRRCRRSMPPTAGCSSWIPPTARWSRCGRWAAMRRATPR